MTTIGDVADGRFRQAVTAANGEAQAALETLAWPQHPATIALPTRRQDGERRISAPRPRIARQPHAPKGATMFLSNQRGHLGAVVVSTVVLGLAAVATADTGSSAADRSRTVLANDRVRIERPPSGMLVAESVRSGRRTRLANEGAVRALDLDAGSAIERQSLALADSDATVARLYWTDAGKPAGTAIE